MGQPLVAIPAFLFVEHFVAVQPVAFGFAAGSMIFIVLVELLPEALQKSSPDTAAVRTSQFDLPLLWLSSLVSYSP